MSAISIFKCQSHTWTLPMKDSVQVEVVRVPEKVHVAAKDNADDVIIFGGRREPMRRRDRTDYDRSSARHAADKARR